MNEIKLIDEMFSPPKKCRNISSRSIENVFKLYDWLNVHGSLAYEGWEIKEGLEFEF